MPNTAVILGKRHPTRNLLQKLFDRALGDRASEFHGVPSWLSFDDSDDHEGWHRVDFGPYQVHFPASQQAVNALKTATTSAQLPTVLSLLDDTEEVAPALACEMDWIEDYNSWMLFRMVVANVTDSRRQVSLADARALDPDYDIDDEMAEWVAEPGELWTVILREAYMLPNSDAADARGVLGELTDEMLEGMIMRSTTPDVPVLVAEIRRLRRQIS